jgi:hypothetical protein
MKGSEVSTRGPECKGGKSKIRVTRQKGKKENGMQFHGEKEQKIDKWLQAQHLQYV